MDLNLFQKLYQQQHISREEFDAIKQQQRHITVLWDLRILLYLGILLLTTGVSILIYKNIDTIGHDVLVFILAIVCAACFIYCIKNAPAFSSQKTPSPNFLFDYVVLLGCILLLTFIGYLQFEFNVFGHSWGLAVFIPMMLLFFSAYYFDHIGVLSLAVTNLAAWVGIMATPAGILSENDFSNTTTIYAGILLGLFLLATSFLTLFKSIKPHFSFTYKNFGTHFLFIGLLAALFHFEAIYLLIFLILIATSFFFFRDAIKQRSFYFLVITLLYAWIGLSYVVVELLSQIEGESGVLYAIAIYFISSGIGLIRLLIQYHK